MADEQRQGIENRGADREEDRRRDREGQRPALARNVDLRLAPWNSDRRGLPDRRRASLGLAGRPVDASSTIPATSSSTTAPTPTACCGRSRARWRNSCSDRLHADARRPRRGVLPARAELRARADHARNGRAFRRPAAGSASSADPGFVEFAKSAVQVRRDRHRLPGHARLANGGLSSGAMFLDPSAVPRSGPVAGHPAGVGGLRRHRHHGRGRYRLVAHQLADRPAHDPAGAQG